MLCVFSDVSVGFSEEFLLKMVSTVSLMRHGVMFFLWESACSATMLCLHTLLIHITRNCGYHPYGIWYTNQPQHSPYTGESLRGGPVETPRSLPMENILPMSSTVRPSATVTQRKRCYIQSINLTFTVALSFYSPINIINEQINAIWTLFWGSS